MKKLTALFIVFCSLCFSEDHLELIVSPEAIDQKIKEVAAQIDVEFQNKDLTVIIVMKGAVCAAADLIREINTPLTLEYIKASSYGSLGRDHGELTIQGIENLDLAGKNVLLVDDIFDSGNTMTSLVEKIGQLNPKSLKTLVVLLKDVSRTTTYLPDYILFTIPNRFVIGYGLDYKEYYRNLPGIYAFINDTPPSSL